MERRGSLAQHLQSKKISKEGGGQAPICVAYVIETVSASHLLLKCDFEMEPWRSISSRLGLNMDMLAKGDIRRRGRVQGKVSGLESSLVAAICWNLWRE